MGILLARNRPVLLLTIILLIVFFLVQRQDTFRKSASPGIVKVKSNSQESKSAVNDGLSTGQQHDASQTSSSSVQTASPPRLVQHDIGVKPETDTCTHPKIPSLVHLVWLTRRPNEFFRIHHHLCILSIIQNIHPKELRFYYDTLPSGRFWVRSLQKLREGSGIKLSLIRTKSPTHIFGKEIVRSEHGTDVIRLDAIRKYGGIYMDLDVIVTRNLTSLMCYDMVLGEELPMGTPNAFMMAVPQSRFAQLWWEEYRNWHNNQWNLFSVQIPAQLAVKHPDLVHVEKKLMMHPNWVPEEVKDLYREGYIYDWRKNFIIHLWYRMYFFYHDEKTLHYSNTTLGEMFRYFYYGSSSIIGDPDKEIDVENRSCADKIPSIVYMAWHTEGNKFQYQHLISIYSVLKYIKPQQIRFYYFEKPSGNYWAQALEAIKKANGTDLHLSRAHVPKNISGKPLISTQNKIDVLILKKIRSSGGIYLDLDVLILKELGHLMCLDTVIGEELYESYPNTFLMSKPRTRFMEQWWQSYQTDFNSEDWQYNSVQVPGDLAKLQPKLVHWERSWLLKPEWGDAQVWHLYLFNLMFDWKNMSLIHFPYEKIKEPLSPKTIIEDKMETPIAKIFRHVLDGFTIA